MEEKDRYYVNKIGRDCLFPDGLWEIKDIECYKWFLVIEGRLCAYKITKKLNQQDTRIKELEKENQQLKQTQKQLAIDKLEKLKFAVLDFSNGYWRYFKKNGEEFMKATDLEIFLKEFCDNQIEKLKGE